MGIIGSDREIKVRLITPEKFVGIMVYLLLVVSGRVLISNDNRPTYDFYMTVMTVGLFFVLLSECVNKRRCSLFLYIVGFFIVSSIYAFRAQTGIDDYNYSVIYMTAKGKGLLEFLMTSGVIEPGYNLMNYLLYSLLGDNYNLAQIIISGFTLGLWGRAIWINKKRLSVVTATFLMITNYYFLIMSGALVRIFIAVAILFIAYAYLMEGNLKKYILYVIIASTFHVSALIMLILVVLKWNSDYLYVHWGTFALVSLGTLFVVMFFATNILATVLGGRYAGYEEMGRFSVLGAIEILPIWLLSVFLRKRYKTDDKYYYLTFVILISLSCIISIYSSVFRIGRIVYYTNIGILMFLSSFDTIKLKGGSGMLLQILVVCYGMLYLFYTCFLNEYNSIPLFPYKSILNIFNMFCNTM